MKVKAQYQSQRGLTLVEIIVVIIILGSVMAFLIGKVTGQGEKAKARLNDMRMVKVKSFIEQYQLQYNTLPQNIEALSNCDGNQGSSCIPIADKDELSDAWGTPFIYSAGNGREFTLKSLGADKKGGGTGVDADVILSGP